MMKQWSSDVILCTDGASEASSTMQLRLQQHDIAICPERIAKSEGTEDGALQRIHLQGGKVLKRTAIFFTTGCHQTSDLSAALGCARDKKGGIITDPVTEESSVRGVYVAGDASRDVLLVAVAIAEGAKAGVAINRALLQDDGLSKSQRSRGVRTEVHTIAARNATNARSQGFLLGVPAIQSQGFRLSPSGRQTVPTKRGNPPPNGGHSFREDAREGVSWVNVAFLPGLSLQGTFGDHTCR